MNDELTILNLETKKYACLWRLGNKPALIDECHVQTLDLVLQPHGQNSESFTAQNESFVEVQSSNSAPPRSPQQQVADAISSCLDAATTTNGTSNDVSKPTCLRLLLPAKSGYVARTDFLQRRLYACPHVVETRSWVNAGQALTQSSLQEPVGLTSALSNAIGALLFSHHDGPPLQSDATPSSALETTLAELDAQLHNRLAFPWLLPDPIPRRRLALIEGRKNFDVSHNIYEAAAALNISLVLFDGPDHWLASDSSPHAHLREAFIPVDLAVDAGFESRIVAAIRHSGFHFDGVMSVSDARLFGVARVAEELGLPTSPSAAYALASDKYRTRMMEPTAGEALTVSSVAELDQALADATRAFPPFPLIVKPCLGWGSECVQRVASHPELRAAVAKASARHAHSPQQRTDVLIEPYIDGPEIDANLVLWDGEVVFADIEDDFPCAGDSTGADRAANFLETNIILPSALPAREQTMLRHAIHASILRQGFRNGVFHCEARVRNSTMHFSHTPTTSGHTDLVPLDPEAKNHPPAADPSMYLLEINARPAGYQEAVAVNLTYGIDHFAQQMLFAINDAPRFCALAHPFRHGPQHHCLIMHIHPTRSGVMKTADPGREMAQRHPDLMTRVPRWISWKKRGDEVQGPESPEMTWLAWYLVRAPTRGEVMDWGEEVRGGFEYELE